MKRYFPGAGNLPGWMIVLTEFTYIGATSFGGGSATVAAMRQLCLRRGWLSEREFVDALVLSRLTPGISILAQALLIGRSVCGLSGMLAGPVGLLAPSITITILLSRLYEWIALMPRAGGALHAVTGVTAGFAVALSLQFMNDVLRRGRLWPNAGIFAAYLAFSYAIYNPLVLMGLSIVLAVAVPSLFDNEKVSKESVTQDEEVSIES